MLNEAKRRSKILEEVRDNINNFVIFEFTGWEKESTRADVLMQYIRKNLTVLRDSVPNFKILWHDIRYTVYIKSPNSFNSSLIALRGALTDIVPREKTREAHEYVKSLSHRISNFSSELSALLDDISDLDENDLKHLSPEISCAVQDILGLSKELEQAISSNNSSK